MKRMFLVGMLVILVSGCATTQRDAHLMTIQKHQMRIGQLERELVFKDDTIAGLNYDVERLNAKIEQLETARKSFASETPQEIDGVRKIESDGVIRISVETKQVQDLLKKAGYYTGDIDNKAGKQTQEAIKAFQKDHGLNADGVVGMKTWEQMVTYL